MSSIIFPDVQGLSISPTLIYSKNNQLCKSYFLSNWRWLLLFVGDKRRCANCNYLGALLLSMTGIFLISDFVSV